MGVGDDGVEMDIGVQKAYLQGAGVSVVDKLVATNCQANSMCFGLVQLDVTDEVGVSDIFILGYGRFGYKKYCVGAFNSIVGDTGFTSALWQA